MQFLEHCFADLPMEMRREAFFYYMDDLALTAATFEELLTNTRLLFEMCRKHGLTLSYQKSQAGFPPSNFSATAADRTGSR